MAGGPTMSVDRPDRAQELVVRNGQRVVTVFGEENGEEVTRYFLEKGGRADTCSAEDIQAALDVEGAWAELDWDGAEVALDRIRHETPPTPPISP